MTNYAFLPLIALLGLSVLFSNCASLTGFQDGRTVGQNNGEFAVSLNVAQSPNFNDWEDLGDSVNVDIPTLFFANMEISGRYGVAENQVGGR